MSARSHASLEGADRSLAGRLVQRLALSVSLVLASGSAMASSTLDWLTGSYSQMENAGGPTTSTLDISNSGGFTTFHLTGADNETFSISNAFQPLLFANPLGGFNAVIPTAALASHSWSTSQYPFINLYSQQGGGGLIISNIPGGNPANDLVSTFSSSPTPYSVSGFPGSPTGFDDSLLLASGSLNATATDGSSPPGCCTMTAHFPSPLWGQNVVVKQSQVGATAIVGNQTMNVAASVWQTGPASGSNNIHAVGNGTLTYYIEVAGSGPTPVPVEMDSLLYTTPDDLNGAGEVVGAAVATVALPGALNQSMEPLSPLSSANGEYIDFSETIFLIPGVEYPVTLTANAVDNCSAVTSCPIVNETAFADPIFTVEGGGTLLLSANLNAIPEPSTWAMLLVGFVGLGLASYCSTRRLATAA
jgi:hypothetical protein